MTNPSDPGHTPRPPAPDQPGGGPYGPPPREQPGGGGPYGPPPGEQPSGPYPLPPQQQPQQPGAVPGPRPPGGPGFGPQDQQQGWAPPPRDPASAGVIGTLFDLNFDHMITTKVTKGIYLLSLVPITLVALLIGWYGLAYLDNTDTPAIGLVLLVAAPLIWLFQVLIVRVLMEFVINQFKISEYLRVIKDKK